VSVGNGYFLIHVENQKQFVMVGVIVSVKYVSIIGYFFVSIGAVKEIENTIGQVGV